MCCCRFQEKLGRRALRPAQPHINYIYVHLEIYQQLNHSQSCHWSLSQHLQIDHVKSTLAKEPSRSHSEEVLLWSFLRQNTIFLTTIPRYTGSGWTWRSAAQMQDQCYRGVLRVIPGVGGAPHARLNARHALASLSATEQNWLFSNAKYHCLSSTRDRPTPYFSLKGTQEWQSLTPPLDNGAKHFSVSPSNGLLEARKHYNPVLPLFS
ncbi:hypothetical protein P280DRAFT_46078 [Massarina eburnea CBS 473.64]|uniref:Uncharacterized protein n=1 Tax=Massarina eburnea CBS 473.64 TaxID=1395130 RepID=A0A6A6RWI1_9PLEO|nr:hypothetical protein P280DRAFT_46078 [Massarina eburnea CBS 473.64]